MRLRDSRDRGAIAELEFQRRLIELGYAPVMTPAHLDSGADVVVWTSKGWVGVQVKTGQQKLGRQFRAKKGTERPYITFQMRSTPRRVAGKWVREPGGRRYYESRGIAVFAIAVERGFYLIPIEQIQGEGSARLASMRCFWEAWEETLGSPVRAGRGVHAPETEDPLEQMFLLAPDVHRGADSAREVRDA